MSEANPQPGREWTGPWRARDFTLVEEIGRGGMSVVYRAHHAPSQRDYAVKIVTPRAARERDHLLRMISLRLKVVSPCVVRLFGSDKVGDDSWIIMELFPGRSLKAVLLEFLTSRARWPFQEPRRYLALFRAVAAGLQAIHRASIVHCDIKPENIMVRDGDVRIFDFGVAREAMTVPDEVSGTATYMAPEQIRKQPVDSRTDLYSLGVTMYELAMGFPPYMPESLRALQESLGRATLPRAERWVLLGKYMEARASLVEGNGTTTQSLADRHQVLTAHKHAPFHLPNAFPYGESVGRVLTRCLAKDKRTRWPTAGDLVAQLDSLLEQEIAAP